jgi:hypothetical protein
MIKNLVATSLSLLSNRIPSTMPEMTEQRRQELLRPLEPGDIVMTTVGTLPGWANLDYWLLDSHHVHCGLYAGNGKFYEASGKGVRLAEADQFFHGRMKVAARRPDYATPLDQEVAQGYCESQIGKPFDRFFRLQDDQALYCSELLHNALKAMPNSILSPTQRVPLRGDLGVPPDGFLRIPVQTIYDEKSHYWRNGMHHWPVLASAAGGVVLGAILASTAGACLGGLAGTVGSIAVGNYLQTGECFPVAK